MKRRIVILLVVLLLGLLAVLGGWSLRRQWLPATARWLDVGGPPHRVDAVFVLPGDEQVRPFVAAALVKAGFADRAIFPKNAPLPEPIRAGRPTTDEVIRRVLERRGLGQQQIVRLEGDTTTTAQDLEALNRYLLDHPETRVAVVTSHYHTRRTRLLLDALLGERASRVSFISAPTDGFSAGDWWLHETGFFAITSEYLKLAYCLVRYTHLPWYAAAVVAGCCLLLVIRRHRNSAGSAAWRAGA